MSLPIFNFVVDRIIKDRVYPALARWPAEPYTSDWREFVHHWPYTVPCELIEHCRAFDMPFNLYTINDNYPSDSYYPVGLGFFDFSIDYFGLMSDAIHTELKKEKLRVLFYYHEGDNPYYIRDRLDSLCAAWELPTNSYRFVSGNTAAKDISRFIYFPDHELLYWRRNQAIMPLEIHQRERGKDFTVLSRTHKWWRATVMADLQRRHLLDNSYWSYNTQVTINDRAEDNPIEIDTLEIREYLQEFIENGPYRCDQLTSDQHNDHSILESAHYTNSSCNIILETHFDADQSGGTFLSEKTFKAIKHGQPFVIVGPVGSLKTLRSLGYRTFDRYIDNTYDLIENNTERWLAIVNAIQQIKAQDLLKWTVNCWTDAEHNQQLFRTTKYNRLNMLLTKLQTL